MEKFADIRVLSEQEAGDFDELRLKIDNATRWNSLYLIIERAIKLRDRIDLFCLHHPDALHGKSTKRPQSVEEQQHLLKHDILSGDDWLALNEVIDILKLFYDLTKRAEGTKLSGERGVLSDYMITLNILLDPRTGNS